MKFPIGRFAARAIAILVTISITGCATWDQQNRTTKGAVYGTAAGAATGAAIGGILEGEKGAGQGAAIGAVVGLLAGGLIGNYMDKQAQEMAQILDRQDRIEKRQDSLQVSFASDVLFESGKAFVQPGGRDKLRDFAGVLNRYPRTNIEVVGHTDSKGSPESNYDLSLKRARAVADEIASGGVLTARISTRGEGETRPVATNDTPEGRAQNRRVEIRIIPDEGLQQEQRSERNSAPEPR